MAPVPVHQMQIVSQAAGAPKLAGCTSQLQPGSETSPTFRTELGTVQRRPPNIPKPTRVVISTIMLETSDAAFGVGHFRHLTGNWDDIKFSPVIRGLKSHAKAARDNNKGIDPYIPRFEEQGETVIRTTNQLVLQSVSTDPTLHCNTRAVMLDMLRSTENSDMKDKRHQMWLLKWLMGQVRRSELKTSAAKRKAGYEGPKRSASKDAGLGSMYIIRREDSGPRIQDGPTTVNVSGNDPGRCLSKTETRKKREGLKISELVACGASMN